MFKKYSQEIGESLLTSFFTFVLISIRVNQQKASPYAQINGELKQQRRRRLRKRHLKSEFALPQTLSRLFHLV